MVVSVFGVRARGSTVGRELRGGLVTFVTMSYIVVLNPLILGSFDASGPAAKRDVLGAGLPVAQVAAVTALVAGVMTLLFGAIANYPFAIATGLGINTLVAVTIAPQVSWPEAMGLVVVDGLIIMLLAATGFRTAVFNAVPAELKAAIAVGIGLFISFIGLIEAVAKVGPSNGTNHKGWNLGYPALPSRVVGLPDLSLVGDVSFGAFARLPMLTASLLVFT